MIGRDHLPQLDELLRPLPGMPEARHPVTELPKRELRIVLDMKVQIDQTRYDRAARQVNGFCAGRRLDRRALADLRDPVPLDYDAAMFDRRGSRPVDHAHIVEHQGADLAARRGSRQHRTDRRRTREPPTCVAHGQRLYCAASSA